MKSQGVSVETFITEHLTDASNDQSILSDNGLVEKITSDMNSTPSKSKNQKAKATPAKVELDQIQSYASGIEKSDDDEPVTKKMKLDKPSLLKRKAVAYNEYTGLKIEGLKDVLRWNRQPLVGTKPELLLRIIDGHVFGRLAPCTVCGQGKLRPLDSDSNKVMCKGYFDKELATHVPCNVTVEADVAPRFQPWYKLKPTKEEEELMDKEYDSASGKDETASAGKLLDDSDLLQAVKEMEWDTSSPKGIKAAASTLAKLCSGESSPLDSPPEAKARKFIGKLVLENKTSSAEEILKIIVSEFGLKAAKEEKAKLKTEGVKSSCACPSNAKIVEVGLLE